MTADESHEAWLAVFAAVTAAPADARRAACPNCGHFAVRFQYVADATSKVGFCALWCENCGHGHTLARTKVPDGIDFLPLETSEEDLRAAIPSFWDATAETSLADDLKERLEDATARATSWHEVYKRLRELVPEGDEQRHRALIWAFAYDLISPDETDRLAREGSVFGAMFEFAEGRMPPRLAEVPDEDVAVWMAAFEAVPALAVRSRIGDLLWSRKAQPAAHRKAREACEALIDLSRLEAWDALEQTEGLVRALNLSRELNDEALMRKVAERVVEVVEKELGREDRPGISFRLLRALVGLPQTLRPKQLMELVRRSAATYGKDPHHLESAIELEAVLTSSPDDRRALRVRQAELWRDKASEAEGILRVSFLEKALDVARTHGLADLARDLRVEVQGLTEEDLDLKTISTEVEIDREEIERFHAAFVQFDSWQTSLAAFGAYGPPGGDIAAIERQVAEQMKNHPLQYLIRTVVIDPDFGVPVFHAVDDDSHKLAAMAQSQWMASQFWAVSAVAILERFVAHYGRPSREHLTEFFTSTLVDTITAERIALAFELWWDDRSDESAHVLVPRLETSIRNAAREVGLPIIREPYGGKPGGVRPLGELLHQLRGRFASPGWHAYLLHLLVDPLGLNLRNVVAHGVRARIERTDAALLLHAATFLRLVEVQKTDGPA
jgi:hypothetical protein